MAEKKIEKGSEEWQFFQEIWAFRQKYYYPEINDSWFEKLMEEGNKLIQKYRNTEFEIFAKCVIFGHYEDVQIRFDKMKKQFQEK